MKKTLVFSLIFYLFLLLMSSAAAWAESPVAMLTEINGEVMVNGQPAGFGDELKTDSLLELNKNASAKVVFLQQGDEVLLNGPMTVDIKINGAFVNGKKIKSADLLGNAGIDLDLGSMTQAAIVMRGAEVILSFPVEKAVLHDGLIFKWNAVPADNMDFRIEISSADSDELLHTGTTEKTRYHLPPDFILPRDTPLSWKIIATNLITKETSESEKTTFHLVPAHVETNLLKHKPAIDSDKKAIQRYHKMLETYEIDIPPQ